MKMKFLCGALLLSMVGVVGHAAPSVEELEAQMDAKFEQMNLLSEKIIKLDGAMELFKQKGIELGELFIEAKQRRFLSENPGGQISEQELRAAFKDELMRFVASCFDIKNKTGGCIVSDAFFNGIADRDTSAASAFRFYLIKWIYDNIALNKLISAWERLSDEYLFLETQVKAVKGL